MSPMETTKEKVERIVSTRRITRRDQKELMLMFSQGVLTSSDRELINKIYEALSKGFLRVVD